MICPYNVKKRTTVLQWVQTNQNGDGENDGVSCEQIETVSITMMDCPKEGCAVWRNGSCYFSGEIIQDA